MLQEKIAGRYAKSIIDLAKDQSILKEVFEDFKSIDQVCQNAEISALLKSPVTAVDKKKAVFKQMFDGKVNSLTLKFIYLLIDKGRESGLSSISTSFINQYKNLQKIKTAKLISPIALTDSELMDIKSRFNHWLKPGETMELSQKTDASLIGGFILSMDDLYYDASVKRQLEEMKDSLYDTSYINLVEKN